MELHRDRPTAGAISTAQRSNARVISSQSLIPDEWLEPSATGSAQQCVDRIRKEFDYGADAVIMHGATPDELEPIVDAYRASQ